MEKSEKKTIRSEKKLNEIDIDNLIKFVYNKIAEWHNEDTSSEGLKHVSIDLIKECINHTLKQIGITEVDSEVIIDKGDLKD
jgi:hypothetical protein|tara:strand:+ start:974 stop:1219 length:246 start_codon:yes stop_codon:yes gene_type:complete